MRRGSAPSRSGGVTYLGVLVLVTLIGLSLALAAQVASTSIRRDKEQQLLWVGHQYREAIGHYFARHRIYPPTLEALLGDPGTTAVQRDIRSVYPDPMTGLADWILISGDNGIHGVASRSTQAPLKTAGFDEEDVDFDKASSYADWKFVYDPNFGKKQPQARGTTFGAPTSR